MNFNNAKKLKFSHGSLCFWSWNDDINKKEIEKQLLDFSKGCFSGVVIHSRAGLRVPYLEEEWFELYRFAVKLSKKLGLEVWIYDEDGWPSGFAGGKVLALGEKQWAKKLVFSNKLPQNQQNILAAWKVCGDEYESVVVDCAKDGNLVCYYDVNDGYVDLLSKETVKHFMNFTHEKYKEKLGESFGDTIKGFFTDEPQLMPLPWSECLDSAWKERYNTDIKIMLYMLYVKNGDWQDFRAKYFGLVSELFYNAFTLQIANWCDENNLLLTGHYATEDSLIDQMITNCGVMKHYKTMGMPGIDHLGNRNASPVLMKQVSSVANQFGIKNVLSETFGCSGWDITFDELLWIWGRQSALGITKPCFHLSAYSIAGRRKRDFPAFFSYQEPWWDSFSDFMKNINGLNALMSDGVRSVDTLVIAPMANVRINFNNNKAKYYSCQYRVLLENLLENQLDFELADEEHLRENAYICGEKICIGNSKYSLVIMADGVCLDGKISAMLKEFKRNGGKIWYINNKPDKESVANIELPDGVLLQNRMKVIEKTILKCGIKRPILLKNSDNKSLKNGAIIHCRNIGNEKIFHIWTDSNFSSEKTLVLIETNNALSGISRVNLEDGTQETLDVFYNGKEICTYVDIKSSDNIVLVLKEFNSCNKEYIIKENIIYINNPQIRTCEQNAINLDYAAVAFENEDFGEFEPVVKLTDKIYARLENSKNQHKIRVKYRFFCEESAVLKDVNIVVESEFVTAIKVNGTDIEIKTDNWWIDRKFFEYKISGLVCGGENEIVIQYNIVSNDKKITENDFETERNRFFRLIELESVYVKGDFDVNALDCIENHGNYYRVPNNFILSSSKEKHLGDLTAQGMWFYRGNAEYRFDLQYDGEKKVKLFIKNAVATCAQITINGKTKMIIKYLYGVDIQDMLEQGENLVKVRLIGNNRNLLGPHHHIKGVSPLTGPNTFLGVKGFEDFASPEITEDSTWIHDYTFVPFGCDGFYISYTDY